MAWLVRKGFLEEVWNDLAKRVKKRFGRPGFEPGSQKRVFEKDVFLSSQKWAGRKGNKEALLR